MSARFLTTATMATIAFAGILPAKAADSQLLNLVMPDAKVLAGVNVEQAKTSPMGQYVLTQVQAQNNQHLREITAATGFDPTRDVHEVLVATTGADARKQSGLILARGNFDVERIKAAAAAHQNGPAQTVYNGVTILSDPKMTAGIAFLSSTLVLGGDMANVKAAIDRQTRPASLPADVIVRVNQWSGTQDAWAITTVAPTTLLPIAGMPQIPGVAPQPGQANAFTGIQYVSAGVKFGSNVVVTTQAQAATATDATQLGDTVKLLASLAQMQSNGDPKLLELAKSLSVTTSGSVLNVSVSMPQDQLVAFLKEAGKPKQPAQRNLKKM